MSPAWPEQAAAYLDGWAAESEDANPHPPGLLADRWREGWLARRDLGARADLKRRR